MEHLKDLNVDELLSELGLTLHDLLSYVSGLVPVEDGAAPTGLEDARRLARARGGECLSDAYLGPKVQMRWECMFGHEWDATYQNVNGRGSWCPHCKINVGEELARTALEEAFPGQTFTRNRRVLGGRLELDGFNPEMRLAFEYQGEQHFVRVPHFQREDHSLETQQRRDARKRERCLELGIRLIEVPYVVPHRDVRAFVRGCLNDLGLVPAPTSGAEIDFYNRVRATNVESLRRYAAVRATIEAKGGECLSPGYLGYRIPMEIRCKKGHLFEASPEAVCQPAERGPRFCPECGGTKRQTADKLRTKVEGCGFEFLGERRFLDEAGKSRLTVRVKCPEGHVYDVLWDNFCPKDGVPRRGCGDCHKAKVAAHGGARRGGLDWLEPTGLTLLGEFTNLTSEYDWRCAAGHEFRAKARNIKKRLESPCTECSLLAFAARNRLELLARPAGAASATALRWKCLECGEEFAASWIVMGCKTHVCEKCCRAVE